MGLKVDLTAVYVIWLREVKKFWRERTRIITAIAQPLMWLFIMGVGLGSSFKSVGFDYLGYVFPGIVSMTVLFASVNSGLGVVWDREFGFFKEILISPVSRAAIVMGKILAGSTTALIQGLLIFLAAPLVGVSLSLPVVTKGIIAIFLLAFSLSSAGVLFGVKISTFHSYSVVMNFVVMPLFLLSGAVFPLQNVPRWIELASRWNPVSYGVDVMRLAINGYALFSLPLSIGVLLGLALITGAGAVYCLQKEG